MNAGIEAANTHSYTTAEKELDQALTIDPENHMAAYTLGQVFVKQEKWDKATDALTAALEINDADAMVHYHLGHAYMELGKLDLAKPELEKALTLNKRLYKAHYFLGLLYAVQDHAREASASWTEAAKLNPGFGKSFVELGKLYYTWDYYDEAVRVLETGAQHARDLEDRTDIYYQLGLVYDARKATDKAISAYEHALDEKKDNLDARLQLGFAYATKGDKAKAKQLLDEFVKQGGSQSPFKLQAANDRLLKLSGE